MGSINSGRKSSIDSIPLIEETFCIDAYLLKNLGAFKSGARASSGKYTDWKFPRSNPNRTITFKSVEGEGTNPALEFYFFNEDRTAIVSERVSTTWYPGTKGGRIHLFVCKSCKNRYRKLYLRNQEIKCRHCHQPHLRHFRQVVHKKEAAIIAVDISFGPLFCELENRKRPLRIARIQTDLLKEKRKMCYYNSQLKMLLSRPSFSLKDPVFTQLLRMKELDDERTQTVKKLRQRLGC